MYPPLCNSYERFKTEFNPSYCDISSYQPKLLDIASLHPSCNSFVGIKRLTTRALFFKTKALDLIFKVFQLFFQTMYLIQLE